MEIVSISVTEASRNFAECVNRARYQDVSFILLKGGTPVARIVPEARKPTHGHEVAEAWRKAVEGSHLGEEEATAWLHDLEQARSSLASQAKPWRI